MRRQLPGRLALASLSGSERSNRQDESQPIMSNEKVLDFNKPAKMPEAASSAPVTTKRKKVKAGFSLSLAIVKTVAVGSMVFGGFVLAAGVYFYFAKSGLKLPELAGNKIATDPKGALILMGVGANAILAGALLDLPCIAVHATRGTSAATLRMADLMQDRMEERR